MSLRLLLTERPGWRSGAACLDEFAFTSGAGDVEALKAICASCPVRAWCLAEALVYEERHDIWGGLTFGERARLCPICGAEKDPSDLGCSPGHSLMRLVGLIDLERSGDPDVVVGGRGVRPSARTAESCPIPLGQDHATANAYRRGCRCEAARVALRTQRQGYRAS